MKNLIFHIVFLILFGNSVYSQIRFSLPSTGLIGEHLVENDTCYIAVNRGTEGGVFKFMFHKISKNGENLNSWTHVADTHDGNHSLNQTNYTFLNESRYITGRAYDTTDGIIKGILAKFNSDYTQVLNYSNYFYEAYTHLGPVIEENKQLVCGFTKIKTSGKVYFSLVKMDTLGNIIWEKNFINHKYLVNIDIHSVLKLPDNGYLLQSYEYQQYLHYGQDTDSGISLLIKVDSIGNEIWRKRIGNLKTRINSSNAVLLSDSNYLVSWSDQYLNQLTLSGVPIENDSNSLYIAKISKSGNIMWEKDLRQFLRKIDTFTNPFQTSYYHYELWQMKKLKDGEIVIIGGTGGYGFMLKTSEKGEPIWYRKYYPSQLPPLSNSNYSNNGITGMIETSDDGFLLTGFNEYGGGEFPSWGYFTSYLYKTDKYGCVTEGCHKQDKWFTDSVQKVEDSLQVIRDSTADALNKSNKGNTLLIYPNPTQGNLTLKVPASFDFSTELNGTLYDSRGKLIYSFKVLDYTSEIKLNVTKGMYLLKITSTSLSEKHKIIVY